MHAAKWDAVVVGGGPAGTATAVHLVRRGHRVLLLDRSRFPRPKPCGECLNPAAVRALAALGLEERVLAAGAAPLVGWRVQPACGGSFVASFPPGAGGLALPRTVLDALLLDHARAAGVEVRLGEQVSDLLRAGTTVAGVRTRSGEIRARLVIGADGLRSVVMRRLGLLRRAPRLRKLALAAHLRGVPDLEAHGVMYVREHGCVGVAEVGRGLVNVVVVVGEREAPQVAGRKEAFFDHALRQVPLLAGAARVGEARATGPFDWPVRAATTDGALLVGDAAGYYDPFTGQGIYRALRGAELAAEVVAPALRRGDVSVAALAPYERARRRAFGPGERVQRALEALVSRPRLLGIAGGRLARHPALADALVAVTGDLRPVRSLLDPRLLAG